MRLKPLIVGLAMLSVVFVIWQTPSQTIPRAVHKLVYYEDNTEEIKLDFLDKEEITTHEEPDNTVVLDDSTSTETPPPKEEINVLTSLTFGIALVSCDSNLEKTKKLTSVAQRSAILFRQYSPNLNIALLTCYVDSVDINSSPFTDIIDIPSSMVHKNAQTFTRTKALRYLLPYNLTLYVESDTIACGDISIPLQEILASPEQMKYAIASANHEELRYSPDSGVVLLNNVAPGFNEVMDDWMKHHKKRGVKSNDEQGLKDLSSHYLERDDVHMGFLHSTLSCRWHPGYNQTWSQKHRNWDQTLTLNGFVYILHMFGGPSTTNNELCKLVNDAPDNTRVMVWRDHKKYPYPTNKDELFEATAMAYSQVECQRFLDGYCYRKLQWDKLKTKKYITSINLKKYF